MNTEPSVPMPSAEDLTKPEYTEKELQDLESLRILRSEVRRMARTGHPGKRALAKARAKAVEIEVRKIHRRFEKRVRIAERKARA